MYSRAIPLGDGSASPSKPPIMSNNYFALAYTPSHRSSTASSYHKPAVPEAFITPPSNLYSHSVPKKHHYQASSSPDYANNPTRPTAASNRANAGLVPRMATMESNLRSNEWKNTIVQPLRKILTFFRGKCVYCYIQSEPKWHDHTSDDCAKSKILTGMNTPFKKFRESVNIPKGICYGCYVDTVRLVFFFL